MNELEAINFMLGEVGSDEVNSLTLGHPDVDAAVKVLKRAREKAQRKGWWFNTDYNVTLNPEAVTKKVRVVDLHTVVPEIRDHVKRGDFMYDVQKQSFQFDVPVKLLQYRRYLAWDDLPDTVKDHVLYTASADFVRSELEDPNKEASLRQDAKEMLIEMNSMHLEVTQPNMFDRQHVRNARAGVRPAIRRQTPLFTPTFNQ